MTAQQITASAAVPSSRSLHLERLRLRDDEREFSRGNAPFTLQRALALPTLRSSAPRVVASVARLDQSIRAVLLTGIDHADATHGPGGLYLAASTEVGSTPFDQRRLVHWLTERQACGLIVQLGPGAPTCPETLLRAADEGGLVVIELHRELDTEAAATELRSCILARELTVMRQADEVMLRLTNVLIDGGGTPEILSELAETVENPVILTKSRRGVFFHNPHRSPVGEVLRRYELLEPELTPCHDGDVTAARSVPGARGAAWGSLVLLGHEHSITDFDMVVLERVALLLGIALRHTDQEASLIGRQRGNFLADVATGRLSTSDAVAHARSLGFCNGHRPLLPLAVVTAKGAGEGDRDVAAAWVRLWRAVREHFDRCAVPAIIGSHGSHHQATVLVAIERPEDRIATINAFVDRFEAWVEKVGLGGERAVVVAGAVSDWDALPGELRRLTELGSLAGDPPANGWHDAAKPDFAFVLWRLRDDAAVLEFSARMLRPISEHDRDHTHKLMPTLEALSTSGWQMSRAAQALFLSRRSMYPRISRIEELLGCSLGDIDVRLGIDVALRTRGTQTDNQACARLAG